MKTINASILNEVWDIIGPQQNRTKAPLERVQNAFSLSREAIHSDIKGDFVEAGVWKGGISATMGRLCEIEGKNRKVWSFDSFQGMSPPDPTKDLLDSESSAAACYSDPVQLRNFNLKDFGRTCFEMVGLKEDTINVCEGWVDDTIPKFAHKIKNIAILRVDLDWYEPTKKLLEALYPKVSKGGYVICDDYGCWRGARDAIDEYRAANNITDPLIQTPKPDGSPQPSLSVGTEHFWKVS
jgi:hypothetical protein